MSKIDIDKLVLYLMKYTNLETFRTLRNAIRAQGLDFDSEDEVLFTPLIIKKGDWFVCIKKPTDKEFPFEKNYLYQSTDNGFIYNGENFYYQESKCKSYGIRSGIELFRPAKEDEIPCEPIFKVGDAIRYKGTTFRGEEIKEIKNYRYYFNDCQSLPFNKQDLWEKI